MAHLRILTCYELDSLRAMMRWCHISESGPGHWFQVKGSWGSSEYGPDDQDCVNVL
jgi:hypothetical protein